MASFAKNILKTIKENRVLTEMPDASGAQDQGGTHVKGGEYIDLGPAIVSPTGDHHPDYTRGVPSQALRKMDNPEKSDVSDAKNVEGKVTDDEIEQDGNGPKLKTGDKIVAEDNDGSEAMIESAKKFLKKFVVEGGPTSIEEDTGADAENQRQYNKRAQGEPIHHLGDSQPNGKDKAKPTGAVQTNTADAEAHPVTEQEIPAGYGNVPDNLPGGGMKATQTGNMLPECAECGKTPCTCKDHKDMKEDITALFAGESITEAFKTKATLIFETAVNARVKAMVEAKTVEVEDQYQTKLEEEVTDLTEALAKKLDVYLNYIAEEWIKANTLPAENIIRASIAEEFMAGLHTLFTEHYIEVPASKVDLVATLASKVDELTNKLNEQIENNVKLTEENANYNKDKVFTTVTEGLTASQVDKLKTLSESVEFKNADGYKASLDVLREHYFPQNVGKEKPQNLTEDKTTVTPVEQPVEGEMAGYLGALKKLNADKN